MSTKKTRRDLVIELCAKVAGIDSKLSTYVNKIALYIIESAVNECRNATKDKAHAFALEDLTETVEIVNAVQESAMRPWVKDRIFRFVKSHLGLDMVIASGHCEIDGLTEESTAKIRKMQTALQNSSVPPVLTVEDIDAQKASERMERARKAKTTPKDMASVLASLSKLNKSEYMTDDARHLMQGIMALIASPDRASIIDKLIEGAQAAKPEATTGKNVANESKV